MVRALKKVFRGEPDHPNHTRNNRTILILSLIFSGITAVSVIGGGFYFIADMRKDIDSHSMRITSAENYSLSALSQVTKKADQRTLDSAIMILNTMNDFVKLKNQEQDKEIQFLMDNCRFKARGESSSNNSGGAQ